MKQRYNSLNGLRSLACIGIVLMHIKANIIVKPSNSFLTSNIIGFTSNFVLMFMMVSAFGLCCGYYSRMKEGGITPNAFYSKRYTRVLPFFALLSLIDVVLCIVSEHFSLTDSLVGELWEAFANLTLTFGLIPGNDISVVGVGWFLGVIFLFYMLFPYFVFLIDTKKRAWITTFISVILYLSVQNYFNPVKSVAFGNSSFIHCAPFFMVGGLIYLYRDLILKVSSWGKWSLRIITIGYTVWFFVYPEMRFTLANLIMYALWVMYAIVENSTNRKWTLLNNPLMTFLSGVSMEVYLSHMMIFRAIEKIHLERYITNNDINYWITCILTILGAVSLAWFWKKWCESRVSNIFV